VIFSVFYWIFVCAAAVMGLLGYILLGSDAKGNIFENFSPEDPFICVIEVGFFFLIVANYPVAAASVQSFLGNVFFQQRDVLSMSIKQRCPVLFVTNIIPLVGGIFIGKVTPLLWISGALIGNVLNFIFPPLVYLLSKKGAICDWKGFGCIVICLFGASFAIICSYQAAIDSVKEFRREF
jgi:Mn2+/Fe2+ NRAMP family transporter